VNVSAGIVIYLRLDGVPALCAAIAPVRHGARAGAGLAFGRKQPA
jgi:hypothetical protein